MKRIYIISIVVLVSLHVNGQGLYLKFGGGYAVPMGSQSLMEPTETTQIAGNSTVVTTETTSVKGSYGAGVVINGAVGFKFSPFIGLDLNLFYQLGKEYNGKSSTQSGSASATIDQTKKSTGYFAAPTMMFMAGTENVRPYAVVGVITGFVKLTDESNLLITGTRDIPISATLVEETKGNMAFGFRGGIGVDVNINSTLSLYAEGIFNSISYYPEESEIVKATSDGDNVLDGLTVSAKKTKYVDEVSVITIDGSETSDPEEPSEELRKPLPLSSLSLSVGLKIKLGSD